MKQLTKAVLEQDHQRKMKAKLRNSSYKPWKSKLAVTKDTPFGDFGTKTKQTTMVVNKMGSDSGGQGSIDVRRLGSLYSFEIGS